MGDPSSPPSNHRPGSIERGQPAGVPTAQPWTPSEFLVLGASTLVLQGTRLAAILVAAKFLDSGSLGLWNAVQAAAGYALVLQGGVVNGMNREVPLRLGQGDDVGAARAERAAAGVVFAAGSLALLVGAAGLLIGGSAAEGVWATSLGALLAASQLGYSYGLARVMARMSFSAVAVLQMCTAAALAVLVVLMVPSGGLPGLVAAFCMSNAVGAALGVTKGPATFPAVDRAEIRRLLRVGTPIMLVGFAYSVFTSVDRWVILFFAGADDLGLYTPVVLVASAVIVTQQVLAQQYYPRMSHRFGSTFSARALSGLLGEQTRRSLCVAGVGCAMAALMLPSLIAGFLPRYGSATLASVLMSALGIAMAIGGGAANALNTIGRSYLYLAILGGGIVLAVALQTTAWTLGLGATGVAGAAVVAHGAVGVVLLASFNYLRAKGE